MMNNPENKFQKRCPRLGGPVSFQYCRDFAGETLPCWKIFECWWELFDVTGYLKDYLSEEDFNRLVQTKPKTKVLSLVDLIQNAEKTVGTAKSETD
jgi:hypothetical protein